MPADTKTVVKMGNINFERMPITPNRVFIEAQRDPKSTVLLLSTMNNKPEDIAWWGLRERVVSHIAVWIGGDDTVGRHSCETAEISAALIRDETVTSGVREAVVHLAGTFYLMSEGMWINWDRASIYDRTPSTLATAPGEPKAGRAHHEQALAAFLAKDEVSAAFERAFAELRRTSELTSMPAPLPA